MISHGFVLFYLCNTFLVVHGWNLDVHNERVFKHPSTDSYFGYSLAAYESNNKSDGWLVGSPGENVFQGAVYKCNLTANGFDCNKLQIQRRNTPLANMGWLGATVVSRKGFVLACAPRATNENETSGEEVDGRCYISNGNLQLFRSYPLPSPRWICMSGFSATFLIEDGNLKPKIGAPTCFFPSEGGIRKPVPTTDQRLLFAVEKWDKWYLGYTMAFGMYGIRTSDVQTEFILATVGFHINSSFAGKIYFIDPKTTTQLGSLTGYQPGEHFGASLAVFDINGDERDDIIIGAPHHSDYDSPELKTEIGAVYIYYQTPNNTFQRKVPDELIIKGQTLRGRFGFSVAALGDIDADGFNDLAVGAPYENDGFGTVYIYRGSKTGLIEKPSQIISGTNYNPPIRTFGFTLTAADFDGNHYSDLVVGSYESATVAYIPARPIANITAHFNFISEEISLSKKECPYLGEKNDLACSEIKFCLTYNGFHVPKEAQVKISLILDIDLEKASRRLLFLENKSDLLTQTITLEAASSRCLQKVFYVIPSINENSLIRAKITIEIIHEIKTSPVRVFPIFQTESVNIVALVNIVGKTTSWWEYLASVLGAVLILAIVVGVLYKLGFFKRKLPPTEQAEGEQLTQNPTENGQQENL